MKQIIIIAFASVLFSCEKRSHLDFNTDKTLYAAGETIKLSRQSEKGKKLIWIMPDGQKKETFDAEFVTDPNMGFGELSFTLKDESKLHIQKRQQTKTVKVYPASFLQDSGTNARIIHNEINFSSNSSSFTVKAGIGSTGYQSPTYDWLFNFPPGTPNSGTYSILTTSVNPIPANSCYVVSNCYKVTPWPMVIPTQYTAGIVSIEYIDNIMHVSFTSIRPSFPGVVPLSGSLYLPQ